MLIIFKRDLLQNSIPFFNSLEKWITVNFKYDYSDRIIQFRKINTQMQMYNWTFHSYRRKAVTIIQWKSLITFTRLCVHRFIFHIACSNFMVSVTPICILFSLFSRAIFRRARIIPWIQRREFLTSKQFNFKHYYKHSIDLFSKQIIRMCSISLR